MDVPQQFDLVVIGSGPAGQKAAVCAAKMRKHVAIIDRGRMVGGVCVHTGTIPSKTFREAVLHLTGFTQRTFYGRDYRITDDISIQDLAYRVETIVSRETNVIRAQLKRNNISLFVGEAKFVDPHTVEVSGEGETLALRGERIMIACGTRPAHSADIPFDGVRIIDTDQFPGVSRLPKEAIVVGAGVVGLECCSFYAALGARVTLIDQRPSILDFVDHEILEALTFHLRRLGTIFRLGEKVTQVGFDKDQDRVFAELESGKRVRGDGLLYAVGRQANGDQLNLEEAGLKADMRGKIDVNESFQTAVPHIYAAGDVIGFPALASTSMEQGRLARCHMFGWVNSQISGMESTFSYHLFNVIFHLITGVLVFAIVRRLVEWSHAEESRRDLLAGFAALVFLLHPVQTEAVAYLAGRSEALSVMLVFAAFTVFLYRRETAASWATAAAVLALFGTALLAKEHTIALAALLLLTDYWWNPGFSPRGIRANWRLYLPVLLGAGAGAVYFRDLIMRASTAGFGLKDFTWYQYFFTQCRALWVYVGLFVLPVNLTADWAFPISKTIVDRGAIFGLAALVGVAAAAWHYRRRFPLAAYGFFVYLVLMAPTSSIMPIKDAIAERRIYFSMLGLLLVVVDMASRFRVERKTLAAACLVVALLAAAGTHARAGVWADAVTLWEDTSAKSPQNWRAHFQLGNAYYNQGRCDLAAAEFEKTAQLHEAGYDLLLDWGLAYDCLKQPDQALAKLRQSAMMKPTAHVYTQIAKVHAEQSRWTEALEALATAEKLDPRNPDIYAYRGKVHMLTNQVLEAVKDYQRALAIDPTLEDARQDLQKAARYLRSISK